MRVCLWSCHAVSCRAATVATQVNNPPETATIPIPARIGITRSPRPTATKPNAGEWRKVSCCLLDDRASRLTVGSLYISSTLNLTQRHASGLLVRLFVRVFFSSLLRCPISVCLVLYRYNR
uniref:Putative secreted protein n=1 Tax=Anopheles darlingi TaxID=43151 RepID=A0A2M4DA83_ANODA